MQKRGTDQDAAEGVRDVPGELRVSYSRLQEVIW